MNADKHLAVRLHGIKILLLKEHADSLRFQPSDIAQTVYGISCESGDGLGQNHIDFSFFAVPHQSLKLRTLLSFRPSNPFIGIDTGKAPVRIFGYVICVIKLFVAVRRYPAVCRHPHKRPLLFACRKQRIGLYLCHHFSFSKHFAPPYFLSPLRFSKLP